MWALLPQITRLSTLDSEQLQQDVYAVGFTVPSRPLGLRGEHGVRNTNPIPIGV